MFCDRIAESSGNREIAVCDGTPASTRRRSRESKSEEQRSLGRSPSGASQIRRAFGERRCRGRASRVSRSLAMELAADMGCAAGSSARGARRASGARAPRESDRNRSEAERTKTRFSRDEGVLRTHQFYLTQPHMRTLPSLVPFASLGGKLLLTTFSEAHTLFGGRYALALQQAKRDGKLRGRVFMNNPGRSKHSQAPSWFGHALTTVVL